MSEERYSEISGLPIGEPFRTREPEPKPEPKPLPPHWTFGRKTTISKDRGRLFADLITDDMLVDAQMRRDE